MVDVTRESMLKLFNENIAKGEALLASNDPRLNKYVGVTTDRGMGLVLEGDTFRLLPPEGDCAKWRTYDGPASAWREVHNWNRQLEGNAKHYCGLMALPLRRVVDHHLTVMRNLVMDLEKRGEG